MAKRRLTQRHMATVIAKSFVTAITKRPPHALVDTGVHTISVGFSQLTGASITLKLLRDCGNALAAQVRTEGVHRYLPVTLDGNVPAPSYVTVRGLSFGLARAYEIARDLHHYRLFVGATRQP